MAIFGEHVRTRFVCLSNICFGITFEIASTILSFEANFLLDVKLCLCCTFGSSAPLNLQDKEGLKHQLEDRVLYLLNQKYFIFLCIPADWWRLSLTVGHANSAGLVAELSLRGHFLPKWFCDNSAIPQYLFYIFLPVLPRTVWERKEEEGKSIALFCCWFPAFVSPIWPHLWFSTPVAPALGKLVLKTPNFLWPGTDPVCPLPSRNCPKCWLWAAPAQISPCWGTRSCCQGVPALLPPHFPPWPQNCPFPLSRARLGFSGCWGKCLLEDLETRL